MSPSYRGSVDLQGATTILPRPRPPPIIGAVRELIDGWRRAILPLHAPARPVRGWGNRWRPELVHCAIGTGNVG